MSYEGKLCLGAGDKKNGLSAVVITRSVTVSFSKTSFVGLQRKGSFRTGMLNFRFS